MNKLLFSMLALFSSVAFAAEPLFFQTPKDKIPNYTANPTIRSTESGNWSSTSTWSCTCVPSSSANVKIEPGHTVTYDVASTAELTALGIEGTLVFGSTINTKLHVGTLTVYRAGRLDIGTSSAPIASDKTAEIVFNDTAIDTNFDPNQYGIGLIVLGEINVYGRNIGKTWSRMTSDLLATQTTSAVEDNISNWAAGDLLVIPDSRQIQMQHKWSTQEREFQTLHVEEIEVGSISGSTITLATAAAHDHKGRTSNDSTFEKYPHIGNLTRNVIFRSENPSGTRAHGIATERAKVDINYAAFIDMGRTTAEPLDSSTFDADGNVLHVGLNQIGRYPFHLHHHMGPINPTNTGYQFRVVGSAFDGCEKWCLSVHNSHWGLINNNVLYDATGSSFMTEEGNERGNEITNNLAVLSGKPSYHWYEPIYGGVTRTPGGGEWHDFGWEGSGFWFTGTDNIVEGNVAATMAYAGVMYNARSPSKFTEIQNPRTPLKRGADIDNASDWRQYVQPEIPPGVISSDGNEVYAAADCVWISFSADVGLIDNTDVWHCSQTGLYSQRNIEVNYDNFRAVNDQSISNAAYHTMGITGVKLNDINYKAGHNVFDGGLIEGFRIGFEMPSFVQLTSQYITLPPNTTIIKNMKLRNFVNVLHYSPLKRGRSATIENTVFERNTGPSISWLSSTPMDIKQHIYNSFSLTRRLEQSELIVIDYNGNSGTTFEVFAVEQAASYVMPTLSGTQDNCPTAGYTNQQCFDNHGKMTFNEIATCSDSTTYPYIDGYSCSAGSGTGTLTVDAGADVEIDEGGTVSKTIFVSGGTGTGRTYEVDWNNDSTVDESGSIPDGASSFMISKEFTDDVSQTAAVTVDDDGSNSDSDNFDVDVNNVVPSGSISGTGTAIENQSYQITVNITDPGDDTITAIKVIWGDNGIVEESFSPTASITHTYTDACPQIITVKVVDEDGTHLIGTHNVSVTCACGQ